MPFHHAIPLSTPSGNCDWAALQTFLANGPHAQPIFLADIRGAAPEFPQALVSTIKQTDRHHKQPASLLMRSDSSDAEARNQLGGELSTLPFLVDQLPLVPVKRIAGFWLRGNVSWPKGNEAGTHPRGRVENRSPPPPCPSLSNLFIYL